MSNVVVMRDMKPSARAFIEVVWPAIADHCGGGELVPCEDSEDPALRWLDKEARIDYLQRYPDGAEHGLASRIQWDEDYGTFTIRESRESGYATELDKMRAFYEAGGLAAGLLGPRYTVHAYVERPELLLAAYVVRTDDLYAVLKDEYEGKWWYRKTVREKGRDATFRAVPVWKLGMLVEVFVARGTQMALAA